MKAGAIQLILLLGLFGCSKPAPPKQFDQLKLTYKPYEKPVVQRQIPILNVQLYASTSNRTDQNLHTVTYGDHLLCFANYDLSEKPEKPNTEILKDAPPGSDIAPIKACLTIHGKEGTTASTPLLPGTYYIGLTELMPDRISGAEIFWDKGKLGSTALFHLKQMTGQLRLDSVSEDAFSGEINISDGDNSMVGTFNGRARILNYMPLP